MNLSVLASALAALAAASSSASIQAATPRAAEAFVVHKSGYASYVVPLREGGAISGAAFESGLMCKPLWSIREQSWRAQERLWTTPAWDLNTRFASPIDGGSYNDRAYVGLIGEEPVMIKLIAGGPGLQYRYIMQGDFIVAFCKQSG